MANIQLPYAHLKYYQKINALTHFKELTQTPPSNVTKEDLENVLCGFHLYNEKRMLYTAFQKIETLLKLGDFKQLCFIYVDTLSYKKSGIYHTWNAHFGNREYKIVMEKFWDNYYYHLYDVSYITPSYMGTAHDHAYLPMYKKGASPSETFVEETVLQDLCGCETVQIELDFETHPISVPSSLTMTPR